MRDKGQISKMLSGCQCFTSVTSRWKQINTVVRTLMNRHFLKEPKIIWNSCSDVPALTNKVCKITWNASCINIAYIHANPQCPSHFLLTTVSTISHTPFFGGQTIMLFLVCIFKQTSNSFLSSHYRFFSVQTSEETTSDQACQLLIYWNHAHWPRP